MSRRSWYFLVTAGSSPQDAAAGRPAGADPAPERGKTPMAQGPKASTKGAQGARRGED
jgi:hypothetical protein